MTRFQFTLIMRTLLAMFHLKLNDYTHEGWEKAFKEYDELQGMFSLWQNVENEINEERYPF